MSTVRNALAYPSRYADAARAVRTSRKLPVDAPFDDAFAYASGIGITQEPDEARWLFELVRAEQPRAVLELGLDEGGTLFLWTRAAAPDARLVSVDMRPVGRLRRLSPFQLVRRGFAIERQHVDLVLAADSHAPGTPERVAKILGRTVDFLFIDGDHSYDGVWSDFRMYSPLVRPGGIVAFHDVSQTPTSDTEGVARFWREFREQHEVEERVAGRTPGYGIGVYRVPS